MVRPGAGLLEKSAIFEYFSLRSKGYDGRKIDYKLIA